MAPQGCPGVEVRAWPSEVAFQTLCQDPTFQVGDVVIEAFGCALPNAFQARMADGPVPVWINLEYLSAEAYVARSHGLASPVMHGPARGATKWFFFPGFTPNTGGLLRELDLFEAPTPASAPTDPTPRNTRKHPTQQATFDRTTWLAELPLDKALAPHERLISLFCYEPVALTTLLNQLSQADEPTRLLVTQGRPCAAVEVATQSLNMAITGSGQLHISPLPYFNQADFDRLLWSCNLNFVRGEDSLVRALWAGQPFVWQLYPQDDGAHHDKLRAFDMAMEMPAGLRKFHALWNGLETGPLPVLSRTTLEDWRRWSHQVRQRLYDQSDLTTQLLSFVAQKR